MNPTIKENLEALRAAIVAHEESLFDLGNYVRKTGCGTLYCSAGLAATMPFFTDQLTGAGGGIGSVANCLTMQESMWGDNAYNRLFARAGHSVYDGLILDNQGMLSDKELALARIDMALQELT